MSSRFPGGIFGGGSNLNFFAIDVGTELIEFPTFGRNALRLRE
jgi:hypothetical protein